MGKVEELMQAQEKTAGHAMFDAVDVRGPTAWSDLTQDVRDHYEAAAKKFIQWLMKANGIASFVDTQMPNAMRAALAAAEEARKIGVGCGALRLKTEGFELELTGAANAPIAAQIVKKG